MWKKCSEGQRGDNCSGSANLYCYKDAAKSPKGENYAGYSDWRLPTITELRSLVYCSNGVPQQKAWMLKCSGGKLANHYKIPTIKQFFPKTSFHYWSSTAIKGVVDKRRSGVDFSSGLTVHLGSTCDGYGFRAGVRLVRGNNTNKIPEALF